MLKNKKKLIKLFISINFFFFLMKIFSQEFSSVSAVQFSPPRYYIGDSVQLNFTFEVDPRINIVVPAYQKNDIQVIEHIEIGRVSHTVNVRVIFRVFVPGTRSIQFYFGGAKVSIPLYVNSVLDNHKEKELNMAYGPLMLRGTRLMVTFFVSLLILLPAGAYFFVKLCNKIIFHRRFFTSPRRKFYKKLRALNLNKSILSDKMFYTKLLDGFRFFLSQNFCRDEFKTATTNTMPQLLLEYYSDQETREIMTLMNRGDMIKFGGGIMEEKERSMCVEKVIFFIKKPFNTERSVL